MRRVRIYDLPLSNYLKYYEIPAYEADMECGEEVRFVSSVDIQDILGATNISDYVLFDDNRLVVLM
jgi:hypothetical protein